PIPRKTSRSLGESRRIKSTKNSDKKARTGQRQRDTSSGRRHIDVSKLKTASSNNRSKHSSRPKKQSQHHIPRARTATRLGNIHPDLAQRPSTSHPPVARNEDTVTHRTSHPVNRAAILRRKASRAQSPNLRTSRWPTQDQVTSPALSRGPAKPQRRVRHAI